MCCGESNGFSAVILSVFGVRLWLKGVYMQMLVDGKMLTKRVVINNILCI